MTPSYTEFLSSKAIVYQPTGMAVEAAAIHPMLFPFQRDLVVWSVRKGRCAVFADTGLGKTLVQLEWARLIGERTLIVAPLSVARQTVREAHKIGLDVHYTRDGADVTDGINITNYEMVDHFQAEQFGAVVLDESSLLKCLSGVTRRKLTEMFADTPYRLCCTATPAPNDITELGNHAEFLGVCTESEMRAMFFINANKEHTILDDKGRIFRRKGSNKGGQEWRLKHPAEEPFFRWLASWAICMTKPSDLGYEDDGFVLPPLNIYPQFLRAEYTPDDQLFFTGLHGIADRHAVRRQTLSTRLEALSKLVHTETGGDQWVIWCGLDAEQRAVEQLLGETCVSIYGSLSPEEKERRLETWLSGNVQFLVSKSRVSGFGLNLQQAHRMVFLGLNDSWEMWYQCIRREWRYGQMRPVNVHVLMSDIEAEIYHNVMRKDAMAARLRKGLIQHIQLFEREELKLAGSTSTEYNTDTDFVLPKWLGGQDDIRVQLSGVREESKGKEKSIEYKGSTEILQPEVQWNIKAWPEAWAYLECRVSLPELREDSSNLPESIGAKELHPEVLQLEVLGQSPNRREQSGMGRWQILPEWLCGCVST